MSGTAVAPMRWWDLDDVREVEVPSFGPDAWTRESFLSEMGQPGRRYRVLRDADGTLLGYLGVVAHGADAELQTIAVAPDQRGRGLGRTLLAAAVDAAREAGARRLDLEVREHDPVAVGMYTAAGFRRQGRRPGYYSPAEPGGERVAALLMRLDLPARREPVAAGPALAAGAPDAQVAS
ncbi:GNAT family N-acetyltransferase [Aquipuribacter hungaricus]|uniref:GNAT family N-acetyltransferase n=1 Tax=Aquipuribacter hungaricus TaxID=545624 RepID=A0ABV7WKI8_9MICO